MGGSSWLVTGLVLVTAGCAAHQEAPDPTQTSQPPQAAVASQIDPAWMTVNSDWREVDRRMTGDYQQFGLRPPDETEVPRGCNGCGPDPATASVTIYAPGVYDPTDAQTGQPVSVGDGDGYYRPINDATDASLAWQYEDDAWATVVGMTTATSESGRMIDLAESLELERREPVTLPLALADVPDGMPLATIAVDNGQYGTTLWFAACGMADDGGIPACMVDSESLRVQIWPTDDYDGHIDTAAAAPRSIGGKDGLLDEASGTAAVQVSDGMLVVFTLDSPASGELSDVVDAVVFAADPSDRSTWPAVADWTE